MKRIWMALGRGIAAATLVAGSAAFWAHSLWTGAGPDGDGRDVVLEIPPGMTLQAAADTLAARGLLKDARVLQYGARLTGQDRGLKAGIYRLKAGRSPRDLLADLSSGRTVQVRVTLAEGLDARTCADIVSREMGFPADRFLAVADSLVRDHLTQEGRLSGQEALALIDSLTGAHSADIPRRHHWCEGYLAPDTYFFGAGSSPLVVALHLVNTQLGRLAEARSMVAGETPVFRNDHQLLTLASIVEAEARLPEERTRIAAVYTNRLEKHWRLEADPTVAYVLHKRGKRMFFKDLEVDSPYNTYRRRGLPPAPIGNPGLACLMATARPDSSSRDMYFVSDGQGGHVFSRTHREHQEAVRRFRKAKADERRRLGG